MALGTNRKYNTLCGLPVTGGASGQLTPNNPKRGTAAVHDSGRIVVIEAEPKTGTGLPTGSDVEQYIVDFGPSVWQLRVFANGQTVAAGDNLIYVVTAVADSYTGNARVGDLTNRSAAVSGLTISITTTGIDYPFALSILDGSGITSGNAGLAEVAIVS